MTIQRTIVGILFCFMVSSMISNDTKSSTDSVRMKNIYLVLDNSGSMKTSDPDTLMVKVVENLIQSLDPETKVGIIIFDSEVKVVASLADISKPGERQKCLDALKRISYVGKYTNIPAAIERAIYDLKNIADGNSLRSIIFITDGKVDLGDKETDLQKKAWLKESLIPEAKLAGIKFFGIAFTDNADFELINEISIQTGGEYYRAYSPNEFEGIFKRILTKMTTIPTIPTAPIPVKTEEDIVKPSLNNYYLAIAAVVLLVFLTIFLMSRRSKTKDAKSAGPGLTIPPAHLIDLDDASKHSKHVINKEVMSIGRDKQNDIWLSAADDTISRYNHAKIWFENNKFYIQDLSRNYTKKNDVVLEKEKKYELFDGDIISFVNFKFKFNIQKGSGNTTVFVNPDESGKIKGDGDRNQGEGEEKPGADIDPVIEAAAEPQDPGLKSDPHIDPVDATPPVDEAPQEPAPDPEIEKTEPLVIEGPGDEINGGVEEPQAVGVEPEPEINAPTIIKVTWCPNCPGKKAVTICSNCMKAFCNDCIVVINEESYCKDCVPKE